MPEDNPADPRPREEQHTHDPAGFTPRSGKAASEYAREQGWQTNEDERASTPREKQDYDGGRGYDYGARDFGDLPVDTSSTQPPASTADREQKPGQAERKKKIA